uniref:Putative ovule protein n=1 Tax=Solanum chacoense TaxID=4108 RepID=A0A0V0J0K0_SOLCH
MPVSGNEEPGVLARQSSSSSSGIPIKKRWNSMFQPPSPIRAEPSSLSNENESKTKCSGLSQGSTLNLCDSTGKTDTSKNSLLEVKEETPSGVKVDSKPTMLPFLSISSETNPNTTSGPSRNVDNLVKPALTQKLASQEAIGTTVVTAVKKEVIAKQGENHSKLELPADSGHVELSLGPKKPHVSSLVDPNSAGSCLMRGALNPSLLSLSLNKGKDISQDRSCNNGLNNNDADDTARTNRSNWDLNTSMDSWDSGDDVPVQGASQIDLLRKTSSLLDIKLPISSASVIGSNGDKGKQVVGASGQEFNFPISIHPSLPYKPVDGLHLSLGSTLRGFDSSVLQSLAKVDSSRVNPHSSLLKNPALSRNTNSTTCKTVKSEPVEEALVQANARTLEAKVGKPEVVRQNLQSIELSTKGPQELLQEKPMKCEPLHEVSQKISMTANVIAHQSVARVLQLQESSSCSSSSSTLPMPLTPPLGCPSRLSTCSDLSVSGGDLSTPSEYSAHTNEANRSKNALDQANADIAAQNANFELKEANVSSDKVETSVSVGMNIEDHMVCKKTQDPHNVFASVEGSANDEEKISISAGTEEECYGSDYESDGHHAIAGHVDTESVGCGREDEEYEDGEVREPIMPSIEEDPIAEGMDSGKNKNDHKDINLGGPLLDKDETTRDDEQRPVSAIYQGSVDQSGIADVQEGCEKDVFCDVTPAGSSGDGRNAGEANNEYIGRSDLSPTAVSSLQNAETPVNATSSKDLTNFGSKSRIISLPRASNVTPPSNFRPITGRSLPSRSGRERYSDMEEEKFHLRRNRDETYADGPKFVRDRIQDRSFGSSRGNFMRGRGRGSARFDSLRREWDSGRDFESYGGVADYRFRPKRRPTVGESEIERNDGPDGHFVRSNTKFTTMQRRNFPRMRSKSPVRSRTRSPGPWSSPRRRLNEGYNNGPPDSSHHRSPAMYREDRMRSSPRTSFTEEIVPRRRDSPSYTTRRLNDLRDVDAVQEHSHPRSLSSRRSPPDRVFTRSNRRLEVLDRRERVDGDEYFDGPIHTARFPELRGGGSTDERRKYGERRGGPVRSFRPSYNSENDNFRFHPNGGPRPFRFYQEGDTEFVERSNTRDREFDDTIKDRPLPRRMRNVEEQEGGNFRQSGQLWHEEEFDVSRLKRRRF